MTDSKKFNLPQLEKLVASATNPRQKAMYQALLEKAKAQTDQEQTPQPDQAEKAKTNKETSETEVTVTDTAKKGEKTTKVNTDSEVSQGEETFETKTYNQEYMEDSPIFQAIGMIVGDVKFGEDGQNTVTIGNQTYPLLYVPSKLRAWNALKKEIAATGKSQQRLIVYPKAVHFPKKEQPHSISFQVVGFDKGKETQGITDELRDFEFKLSGLWQFIPVCRTPCVSILRNFTKERLEYIKQADPARKVKFMKASHIPLLWKDSPVRPFRFNPKATKEEQGQPSFVQVKAKFLPGRDVFGFIEELADVMEKAPKFLKASKKDKTEAIQSKNEQKKAENTPKTEALENSELKQKGTKIETESTENTLVEESKPNTQTKKRTKSKTKAD